DLKNAARRTGREPKNPAQYLQNIRDAMRPLNNEYGVNLQQVAGEIHVPTKVSDMLRAEAASLPEVAADEASQLRDLATSYEKPRTIRDMDRERMWRNAKADAFYKKGELGQMNADQAAASAYIHKKIADGLRDAIYDDVMGKRFPGMRELKLRQAALKRLEDVMSERAPELRSAQASAEGAPLSERVSLTAYGHVGGVRPWVHAGKNLFPRWRGPEAQASRAITKAYRGLSKPRLLDESVKMRAVGNAALADVLEQESGATDLQKAKATVRRIE